MSVVPFVPLTAVRAKDEGRGLTAWFHHTLSWRGKAVVAVAFVCFLIGSSGCLTMAAINAAENHSYAKKFAAERRIGAKMTMDEVCKYLNEENYSAIVPNAGWSSLQDLHPLELELQTAHRLLGAIESYNFLDDPGGKQHESYRTSMELEISASNGKFKFHIEWYWDSNDKLYRVSAFHPVETSPPSRQNK